MTKSSDKMKIDFRSCPLSLELSAIVRINFNGTASLRDFGNQQI
jgi:hypothetical protein